MRKVMMEKNIFRKKVNQVAKCTTTDIRAGTHNECKVQRAKKGDIKLAEERHMEASDSFPTDCGLLHAHGPMS